MYLSFFFFSSRRRHTSLQGDWSSDVCSSDLTLERGHERGTRDEGRGGTQGRRRSGRAAASGPVRRHRAGEIGRASCRERGECAVERGALEEESLFRTSRSRNEMRQKSERG